MNQVKELQDAIGEEKYKEVFEKTDKMLSSLELQGTFELYNERLQDVNWGIYQNDFPFNPSALALYKWAPIADELKTLDKKIVLNSVILKWDIIKKEFRDRIKI